MWNIIEGLGCLAAGVVLIGVFVFVYYQFSIWPGQIVRSEVIRLTNLHLDALVRKRAQYVYRDDYGHWVTSRWRKEIDYFLSVIVAADFNDWRRDVLDQNRDRLASIVESRVSIEESQRRKSVQAYTTQAQQLAQTNGVILLHYLDLPRLERILAEGNA